MVEKILEYAAWLFTGLAIVGLLITGFLFVTEVWAGVAVYGVLTVLYGYLAFSFWAEVEAKRSGCQISW